MIVTLTEARLLWREYDGVIHTECVETDENTIDVEVAAGYPRVIQLACSFAMFNYIVCDDIFDAHERNMELVQIEIGLAADRATRRIANTRSFEDLTILLRKPIPKLVNEFVDLAATADAARTKMVMFYGRLAKNASEGLVLNG